MLIFGCLSGSVLDHRSLPPEFESWCGHIRRLFHVWLCFNTFGGRSAHLAYHVHKSGHKTPIIIFTVLGMFLVLSIISVQFIYVKYLSCINNTEIVMLYISYYVWLGMKAIE